MRDGVAMAMRDDITSLCYALGDYTPGTEVKLNFKMAHMVWKLQPGDQLRVDISSSAFPLYSLHTNVKGLQGDVVTPKFANNTIVLGKSSITFRTDDIDDGSIEVIEV